MEQTQNTKIEEQTIRIEELETFESNQGTDLSAYEGNRTRIAMVTVRDAKTNYDEKGDYQEGLQRPIKVLKVETDVITELVRSDDSKIGITASELFNLKYHDGKWGLPGSDKSKIQKFLKKMKATTVPELVGLPVTIRAYENRQGNTYLGIYV